MPQPYFLLGHIELCKPNAVQSSFLLHLDDYLPPASKDAIYKRSTTTFKVNIK